jgi:acetolactate synthase-1/2/3 large subunit
MKLSDYVAQRVADHGLRHVFMVVGGGAMHLNDSLGHEPRLQTIHNHHEQACAMAAEGYARLTGRIGVINVTTGPGGINALNGVFGAWVDSIPMLVISGQVKRETCMGFYDLPGLRQIGDQEADVISMAKGITKYAVLVMDPNSIRYHLEKALYLATSGRPGPCWLDVPVDVQSSQIDPAQLPGYDPAENQPNYPLDRLPEICRDVLHRLQAAKRPVILPGTGVRLAGAAELFETVTHRLGIPVALSWTGSDLLPNDDPSYCGRAGTIGDRAGNFSVQNSDVLLVIGSRLNIRQVSYNWQSFARCAFKVQVDADAAELDKPTVRPDMPIHCDARLFLDELHLQIDECGYDASRHADWLAWCKERLARYPVVQPHQRTVNGRFINPYHFVDRLFHHLVADDAVVCGNGTASVVAFQVATVRKGQRLFANSGCASMGYDLPAALGTAVARGGKRVICLAGDGSIQLGIQELQTVAHHQLPVKIFVLNNDGYLSIRTTQSSFFGRFTGEGPRSGLTLPDVVKVAQAFGLPAMRIEGADFETGMVRVLNTPGPFLCEVMLDPNQQFEPKLSSKQLPDGRIVSAPLEDLYPFLEREELLSNLFISPMEF